MCCRSALLWGCAVQWSAETCGGVQTSQHTAHAVCSLPARAPRWRKCSHREVHACQRAANHVKMLLTAATHSKIPLCPTAVAPQCQAVLSMWDGRVSMGCTASGRVGCQPPTPKELDEAVRPAWNTGCTAARRALSGRPEHRQRASRAGQSTASVPGRRTVEHLPPPQRWRRPATRSLSRGRKQNLISKKRKKIEISELLRQSNKLVYYAMRPRLPVYYTMR